MEDIIKTVKYKAKDSLFTFIFKDIKYQRKLYASLYDDEKDYLDEDFHLITLENIFVNDVYNDLGLRVKDRLIILMEAQSTFNPNMAVRFLMYLAKTYQDYIVANEMDIYGTARLILPRPEFVVVYTGKDRLDIKNMKLSDNYLCDGIAPIELRVKIINSENVRQNIIQEYIGFCQTFDKFKKEAKTNKDKLNALKMTIEYCISEGILKDILLVKKKEVEDIMMTVFSQEQAMEFALKAKYREGIEQGIEKGIEKGIKKGIEQGRERGVNETMLKVYINCRNKGLSIEESEEIVHFADKESLKLAEEEYKKSLSNLSNL